MYLSYKRMGRNPKHILLILALLMCTHLAAFAFGNGILPETAINIFPNPVVYEANITLDKDIDLMDNEVSLYFYNIVGEEVHILEGIQNHQFVVNKEHFKKSGIYLYQLQMNGEVLRTGKINIH